MLFLSMCHLLHMFQELNIVYLLSDLVLLSHQHNYLHNLAPTNILLMMCYLSFYNFHNHQDIEL